MRVISTNIGEKKAVKWRGKTVYTGIFKSPITDSIILGTEDVENDHVIDRKYHGGIDKACYIYSADHYNYWKKEYPQLNFEHGMFGENITVEGFDDTQIMIGDQYAIGETLVEISQPRFPCFKLGIRFDSQTVLKKFISFERPGTYVSVLKTGKVSVNDQMKLVKRGDYNLGLVELYHLSYTDDCNDIERIQFLLQQTYVTEECKEGMEKRLKALR
ncbi:MOSC domain-containing protein [Paracrocinitomix mangrovi]|uniref:MOSC domain-containing protein n=1 Tax=Paracrocinitomix mangrovi TaxID=2862509 RepID=UPI001C8E55D6|nr:MOSC domain-containing protein [Paracrocinitomix mangrovi]UKN01925.1 MOSC domain-containing protein [Paracrocinitomix mangrovi]